MKLEWPASIGNNRRDHPASDTVKPKALAGGDPEC